MRILQSLAILPASYDLFILRTFVRSIRTIKASLSNMSHDLLVKRLTFLLSHHKTSQNITKPLLFPIFLYFSSHTDPLSPIVQF